MTFFSKKTKFVILISIIGLISLTVFNNAQAACWQRTCGPDFICELACLTEVCWAGVGCGQSTYWEAPFIACGWGVGTGVGCGWGCNINGDCGDVCGWITGAGEVCGFGYALGQTICGAVGGCGAICGSVCGWVDKCTDSFVGECDFPGQSHQTPFGDCGTETETCNSNCDLTSSVSAYASPQTNSCGDCGTQVGTCSLSTGGYWNWGSCSCSYQSDTESCGDCNGTKTRTCSSGNGCNWSGWGSCTGCSVQTDTDSKNCGDCGTQTRTRTCSSANSCNYGGWGSWGSCNDPCSGGGGAFCGDYTVDSGEQCDPPGSNDSRSCGNCGNQNRTCNSGCNWTGWGSCQNQGVCSSGSTQSCTVPGGGSGTQTCSGSCAWGICVSSGCDNNGTCDAGENCTNCPADCFCPSGQVCVAGTCVPGGGCNNGTCDAGENCTNCPADCSCPSGQVCVAGTCVPGGGCNNGTCDTGENCTNCPADCSCPGGQVCVAGTCVPGGPVCPNAVCEVGEDCLNCADCFCSAGQTCLNGNCCGNGAREGGEQCDPPGGQYACSVPQQVKNCQDDCTFSKCSPPPWVEI